MGIRGEAFRRPGSAAGTQLASFEHWPAGKGMDRGSILRAWALPAVLAEERSGDRMPLLAYRDSPELPDILVPVAGLGMESSRA